ncbi:MAG: prepilin-type N-terminal cleavage/methylation domain-containing protein, partial [Planctomycetota bacterium]
GGARGIRVGPAAAPGPLVAEDTEEGRAMRKRRVERGYTLMELLVVMVIIGILSGMLTTAVMVARRKGGEAKTKALIVRLSLAVKEYENSSGDYPPGSGGVDSAEGLHKCLSSPKLTYPQEFKKEELADTDGDGVLEIVDHWRQPLSYHHHRSYEGPPNESTFRIISKGRDGKQGTRDDITNY